MAPNMAGSLHGLVDTIYSAGGFVVPIIGNTLVGDYSKPKEWMYVWIAVIICCFVWMFSYVFFVKSKETAFSGLFIFILKVFFF